MSTSKVYIPELRIGERFRMTCDGGSVKYKMEILEIANETVWFRFSSSHNPSERTVSYEYRDLEWLFNSSWYCCREVEHNPVNIGDLSI